MRFLIGCFEFYRSILTRCVEPDELPTTDWTDGNP